MSTRDSSFLQPVHNLKLFKRVEGIAQIERFFRAAAELDVDKDDIRRYFDFIEPKVSDLLLIAQHTSKANDHVRVEPQDLPITKGLQEGIHAFEAMDEGLGLGRILERRVPEPQFDLPYADETEARLPSIAGGLSVALARTFKIIDPNMKHAGTAQWEQAFAIFNQLL
jgi:hypothetical protein